MKIAVSNVDMKEFEHWFRIELFTYTLLMPFIGIMSGAFCEFVFNGFWSFPWRFFFLIGIVGVSSFLANFKLKKTIDLVRELILLVVFSCVVLGVQFFGHYHCWINGVSIIHMIEMPVWVLKVNVLGSAFWAFTLCCWFRLEKIFFVRRGQKYRDKIMRNLQNWSARKLEGFFRCHPQLKLTDMRQFLLLSVRYAIWMSLGFALVVGVLEHICKTDETVNAVTESSGQNRISSNGSMPVGGSLVHSTETGNARTERCTTGYGSRTGGSPASE